MEEYDCCLVLDDEVDDFVGEVRFCPERVEGPVAIPAGRATIGMDASSGDAVEFPVLLVVLIEVFETVATGLAGDTGANTAGGGKGGTRLLPSCFRIST